MKALKKKEYDTPLCEIISHASLFEVLCISNETEVYNQGDDITTIFD